MPIKTSKAILAIVFSLHCSLLFAQISIGTSGTPPHPSAMLDVQSTEKGLLFPRLTSSQRRNVINPAAGLVVYDTEKQALYLFNGLLWKALAVTDNTPPTASITGTDVADGATGDALGNNVKIYGNYALVGAYNDDIGANTDQGSAYVYRFENGAWSQMQKLVANDGASGDNFGAGLGIDSNYLMIGAHSDDVGENLDQGSVYIFKLENGSWVQKQKITGSNGGSGDIFGINLTMSKGHAVVGASKDDIAAAIDAGSAYIFKLNDITGVWSETQKIYPNDVSGGDTFGNWISISGDKIIVTAIYDDANGVYRKGSAYIYTYQANTWVQTAKLVANDGANNDNFGTNASIHGDFVLVGAYNADATYANQGACYLFKLENNIWVQKQKIVAADATTNGFFGQTASLKDNYAIIGSHGFNGLQGAAYIFQLNPVINTMTQLQKITAADPVSNDYFGYSTDISNGNVIIGAYGKNGQRGKVYFKSID
ncbi:MAG: FG-GAP repeat protein [Bacteroidota bacterium]